MKKSKYAFVAAALAVLIFIVSAVPIFAGSLSIRQCTAEAEGNPAVESPSDVLPDDTGTAGDGNIENGANMGNTEDVPADTPADTSDTGEENTAATIIIALVIAIALIVVIVALLPRKSHGG